jgi:hypothetical protein
MLSGDNSPIMDNQRQRPGSILSWALIGAVAGGLFAAFDGAILGIILGATGVDPSGPAGAALRWCGYFAAGGALLGALIGAGARAVIHRLVLRPPGDVEPVAGEKRPPEAGG